MTTGPTDGTVTTAAGGPDGMPLALKLNEWLGPNAQNLTGDAAWLWTHCRALGMVRKSDSELLRDDVALFVYDLHSALRELVALKGLRDGLPPPGTWARVDAAPVHSDCLRREPLAWAAARAALGPNVRVEAGPAAKPQDRTMENSASPLSGPAVSMLGRASNEGLGPNATECDVLAQLRLRILLEHGGKGDGWKHHWNLTHGDSIMHREAVAKIERLRAALQELLDICAIAPGCTPQRPLTSDELAQVDKTHVKRVRAAMKAASAELGA